MISRGRHRRRRRSLREWWASHPLGMWLVG
jgi:hypothetical protein